MKKQLKFLFATFLLLTAVAIVRPVSAASESVAVLSSDKRTLTFLNAVKTDASSATDSAGKVYSGTVYKDVERGAAQSSDSADVSNTQDDYLSGSDHRSYKDAAKTVTKIVIKDKLSLKTDAFAFADFAELTEIEGLKNLTATTSMAGLVYGDKKLAKLDMSEIDMTGVTSFSYAFSKTDKLAAVTFGKTSKDVNFFHAFEDSGVTTLDLSGMSFSNLNHAFSEAGNLTSVTLPDKFGAKNMAYMFNKAEKLNQLDGSKFDTSSTTNLSYAFNETSNLLQLDTSKWDLSKATNFDHFANGSAVSSIDFSKAKIASADFTNAFSANKHLTSLDLSGVTKATNVASLVSGDSKLVSCKVPFDTSDVTDFSKAFYGTGLTHLDLSTWDTSKAKTMDLMFASSSDLYEVVLGKNFEFKGTTLPAASSENGFTGKWHGPNGNDYTASEMAKLGELEGTWKWSGEDRRTAYYAIVTSDSLEVVKGLMKTASKDKVTDTSGTVYSGKVYNLAEVLDGSKVPWADNTSIKTATIHTKYYFGEHADYFFAGLSNLNKITGLEKFDFTHTLTATHFFDGAGLTSLDATVWDDGVNNGTTSNIKDASYFFANMRNLTNLTIVASPSKYVSTHTPVFDLRNATNLSHLFENDSKITKLILSECIENYWHYYGLKASSAVQNTSYMFAGMRSVTSILGFRDNNGDFSNVTDATAMFKGDGKLNNFDNYVYTGYDYWNDSFRFSKIQKADEMFADVGFKTLDLGRFNGSNLTSAKNMFKGSSITRFVDHEGNFTMNGFDFEDAAAIDDNYSGNWVNSKNGKTYTPVEMKTYKGVFDLTPELVTDDGEKQIDLSGTAYAVLDGKTLKFIRSKESPKNGTIKGIDGITYKGTIYSGFEDSTSIPWNNDNSITAVKFVNTIRPTTVKNWFKNKTNLIQVIGGQNLNLSRVTDMTSMFEGDTELTRVNTSDWGTSHVTSMNGIFSYCSKLVNIDVSKWNTSNVTNMDSVFRDCENLTGLDVSKWNTSKVTSMGSMFSNCKRVPVLDVSNWDISNVTYLGYTFYHCDRLTELDVSKWDTSKVTSLSSTFFALDLKTLDVSNWDVGNVRDFYATFAWDGNLTNLDVSKWDLHSARSLSNTFYECRSLTNLDVSNWDTSNVTSLNMTFAECHNLPKLNVSNWNVSHVDDFFATFWGLYVIHKLDLSRWDTSRAVNMHQMFGNDYALEELDLTNFNTSHVIRMNAMFANCLNLTTLEGLSKWDVSKTEYMYDMFQNCQKLASIDVSNWDTRNVIDMRAMFQHCYALTNLDVSKWNTNKLKYTQWMFDGCTNLSSLGDLSGWDVSNVQDTSYMFNNDSVLTNADVHKWNFANTANAAYMFNNCQKLPSGNVSGITIGSKNKTLDHTFANCYAFTDFDASKIDTSSVLSLYTTFGQNDYDNGASHMKLKSITGLDKWDTSQVTNMHQTFYHCGSLTSLDLSKWNTENVTNMETMFEGVGVKKLDLSNFKGNKVTTANWMLCGMPNVTEIDLSKFDTPNLTTAKNMFEGDPNLKSTLIGKLDLSNVNASGVVNFFNGDTKLSTIDLGPKWRFMTTASSWDKANTENSNMLEKVPTTGDYDGTWNQEYTSLELAKSWKGSMANLYSWTVEKADPNTHVYAVYSNGTLTFIRTTEKPTLHTDNISVEATNGNIYTGRVFEADGSWRKSDDEYVYGLNSKIKTVNLTTKVKPLSTKNWFNGCYDLTSVKNAQRFDMSNNTDMSSMFQQCYKLANLDVSTWDTSKVTDMSAMFRSCEVLTNLDVSKWNTGNVTDMSSMFQQCYKLANLDVSTWDTSKVTDMNAMFRSCEVLTNLDVSNWNTSKVTDMSSMFGSCHALTNLDVSKWNTSNVTDTSDMFYECHNLANLDVSKWDTSKVTDMRLMFYECEKLANLDVSKWDTSKVTNMRYMFNECRNLTNLDVSKWNTSQVTSLYSTFYNCYNLANLDVSNWDTSKVTDMESTFNDCRNLVSLDVSKWDTSNVTTMRDTFSGCEKVASLDVSNWDTSKVTNMRGTFGSCKKVASLDVSKWDTSNVTTMRGTFGGCKTLTKLDLSKWDTSKVTDMFVMFDGCKDLVSLDVSKYDTSKVTNMTRMFADCGKLASLDLSSWDTNNVTDSDFMFINTYELQSLTLGSKFNINSTETDLSDNFNYHDSSLYSKWVRTSDNMIKSSDELMTMDANKRVGTWVAKKMTATVDVVDSYKNTTLDSGTFDNYKSIVDTWAHRGYTVSASDVPASLDPYAPSYKMSYKAYMDPKVSTYGVSTTTPKGTYMLKSGKEVGTKTVNLTITMNGGAYFRFSKMGSVLGHVMPQTPAGWGIKSTKYTLIDGYGKTYDVEKDGWPSGPKGDDTIGGYTVVYNVEFAVDQDEVTQNYGEFTPVLPSNSDSYDAISGGNVRIELPDIYKVTSLATRTSPSSTIELWRDTVYAFYKLTALRAGNHSSLGDLTFTNGRTSHNRPLEDLSYDGQSVNSHITVHMPIDWDGYKVDHMDSYKQYDTNMWFEYFNNYDNPDMAVVNIDNHMFDTTWYKPDHILFDDKTYWREVPYGQLSVRDDDGKFDTSTLTNTYAFLQNSGDYLTAKAGYGLEYPYQVEQEFYDESANYMVDDNETVESAARMGAAPCGYATTSNLYDDTLTSDINHEELRFYTSSKQLNNVPTDTSNVFNKLYSKFESLFYPMQFRTLTNITARSKSLKNGFQTYADVSHDIVIFNSPQFESPSDYASHMMYENNYYDPDHRHVDYIKDNVKDGLYPLNINATIGNVTVNKNFKIQIYGSRMASKDRPNGEISINGTLSGATSDTTDKLKDRYGITDDQAKQLKEFLRN